MNGPEMRHELHYKTRVVRTYAARPRNVREMFLSSVSKSPAAEALVEGSRRLTYLELSTEVDTIAGNLQTSGVTRGDRVALLLGNRIEFVSLLLACASIGAVAVPIGIRLQKPEIEFICNQSGVSILVHEASLADTLPEPASTPGIWRRYVVGGSLAGSVDFAELLAQSSSLSVEESSDDDLFLIAYTSGTSGRPKGAMVTHLCGVHACLNWQKSLGIEGPEVAILAIPATHIGGTAGVILPMLHFGGLTVLMREFRARLFLELAQAEKMTYGVFVPAIYNLCMLNPEFPSFDLSSWRWGIYSGAPMPEATIHRLREKLPGLNLVNAYGATEATSPIAITPPSSELDHRDSVGRVVACGNVIVVDGSDREVPPGEVGELWISGPMIVAGYWQDDAATRDAFAGGFWKSGDIGSVSADGYVRVLDRKKDMINRGGMKVFAVEVENALCEHPSVIEVAVISHPDPVLGERVRAVIVAKEPLNVAEIQLFCRNRLADYKVPELISVRDSPLPRNANGKVLKRLLLDEGVPHAKNER